MNRQGGNDTYLINFAKSLNIQLCKEYRFHPTRKWRFDFAFPQFKVAIEINGGVWIQGRHTRGSGYIKDMEKLNNAQLYGWLVLQYLPNKINFKDIHKALTMTCTSTPPDGTI